MSIFGKRKVELDEEQLAELEERILAKKKIRDLNSENKQSLAGYAGRKLRKEPVRPWGKKERLWVGGILVLTALACAFLALRARSFKLPGFEGGTIIVGKKTWGQKASEQFAEQTKSLIIILRSNKKSALMTLGNITETASDFNLFFKRPLF